MGMTLTIFNSLYSIIRIILMKIMKSKEYVYASLKKDIKKQNMVL